MDRTYQSSSFVSQSPFSPRSRQSINTKRAVAPAFKKSSRFSVSGKSAQSIQVIFKSQYNCIERFGQPLPVLINEALTFADKNVTVSARISESGYAWVVCGRRLLIWQYRQSPQTLVATPQRKHVLSNQCFELQLPQSDLSHRAELVSVFLASGSNSPSCIAVSPEGLVRYWPAIAHEGVSVEQSVDLHGQECDTLTDVENIGCILATTTCSIVLVQPQLVGGRHILNSHHLKAPTGWLGGISKRMSSLIFGPISSEQSAETRLVRVLSVPCNEREWLAFILTGYSIQKWKLSSTDPEQLVFVADLSRIIRDNFHVAIWENCVGDQNEIDTWILDLQYDKDNLILLAAAVNMHVSPQVHYALVNLYMDTLQPPTMARDFKLLKISGLYREDNPAETLSYRLLLSGTCAYLYNQRSITVIRPQEEPDTIEFNSSQDSILGGSICVNTPIFFSKNNGLVAVSSNDMSCLDLNLSMTNTPLEQSFNDSIAVNNLSIYNVDPQETYTAYKDTIGQIKAAFIFHVKNQQQAYEDIVNELFPIEAFGKPGIDTVLDKVIVTLNTDLINDVPAGDPRWCNPSGIGSSYSLQILHQLEDKQKAQALFIRFLKESGLWNRLGGFTIRGTPTSTIHVLAELSEKIVAAVVLKSLPNSVPLEKAIEKAVAGVDVDTEYGLTCQDIFYSKVGDVHKGIQELVRYCEDIAHSDLSPTEIVSMVHEVNNILLPVLKEVLQYRRNSSEQFALTEASRHLVPDYLPWISANEPEGLIDSLWEQHSLTCNYGIKLTNNKQLRSVLCEQLINIIDIILDGRKCHLESIRGSPREDVHYKQYCIDRHKLIKPLLQEKEYEGAAQIAEKYLDFESLVLICDTTGNQSRLDEYIDRFHDEGFSEYVYNWYLKENKQGQLIDRSRKVTKQKKTNLTKFLQEHPSLSWMQQIFDNKFILAANTLRNLAMDESVSVTRQKTQYSLAKLAKLAGSYTSDSDGFIEDINTKLELIAFQEDLPDYVLQQFGYDTLKPSVMSPKQLINTYICSEYKDSTEIEFKKALDLLNYVDDNDLRDELRLIIWRHAILKDSWNFTNLDAPLEILQSTLFFRLVDLSIVLGADPENLLPQIDVLLEDHLLENLKANKSFLYLLKTGYEHLQRTVIDDN